MIKITGSHSKIRELIKSKRSEIVREIRKLEKDSHPGIKEARLLEQKRIERNIYSVSKTLPARFEDIVVDVKLLEKYLKKLKNLSVKFEKTNNSLIVHYGDNPDNYYGLLELHDLSKYFEGYGSIPKVEVSS